MTSVPPPPAPENDSTPVPTQQAAVLGNDADPIQAPPTVKPKRAWYKKKRILIPIAAVLLVGWIGSLGNDEIEAAGTAKPVASEAAVSEEDAAAAEAEAEAKAESDAAETAEKAAEKAAAEEAAAAAEAAAEEAAVAAAAEAAAAAAAAAAAEEAARGTVAQQNAVGSAESYLSFTAFSRSGLIGQLEFEGYSAGDATFAVDRVNPDWNEQAAKSAKNYLSFTSFSRSGLIDQLIYEGFSVDQATYGVNQTGL